MTIFEQFKNEYLNKALKPIHYKKLKKRIHEELSAHIDDMYEDFSKDCDDELEIVKKGAAPTYIMRSDGEFDVIKSNTLPIGVFGGEKGKIKMWEPDAKTKRKMRRISNEK